MSVNLEDIQKQLQDILSTLESKFAHLQVTGNQIRLGEGLSDIDTRLGIVQAGEFRVGNGKLPGDGFTGGRYGFPGFVYGSDTYFLAGVLNDVLQVGMSLTNGKILGGAGDVVVDGDGVWIKNQQAAFGFEDTSNQRFNIYLASGGDNNLQLVNQTGDGGVLFDVDTAAHQVLLLHFREDATFPGVPWLRIMNTDAGATATHFSLDTGVSIWSGIDGQVTVFNDDSFDIDFRVESATDSAAILLDALLEKFMLFNGSVASFDKTNNLITLFTNALLSIDNGTEKRLEIGFDHYIPVRGSSNPNVFFNEANQDMDFQVETTLGIGLKIDAGDHAVYMDGDLVFRTEGSGLPYGSVYGNDIAWTQAGAVQNTWYKISDVDMTDGELNLVTHDGSGKMTVAKAGRYRIMYALVGASSVANKQLQTAIAVNGTENNAGIDHETAVNSNTQVKMGSTAILDVPAGATIEISIRCTDAGTPDISVEHINTSLLLVGGT